jgi:hypothetical protein
LSKGTRPQRRVAPCPQRGGNYRLTEKTRVYGRYALVSSLYNSPYDANSTQQNNVGLIGFESQYSEGGRVFNEYRVVDTIDGRGAQAAMGLRQTLKITDTCVARRHRAHGRLGRSGRRRPPP